MPLLRHLGFLPDEDQVQNDIPWLDDDPELCLRTIGEEVANEQTWLKLFFVNDGIQRTSFPDRLRQTLQPELIKLPLEFTLTDACLTNAPFVWFNRHFYV
ncbi:MAG: hypothetical protein KY475_24710 [Planctomycetes bacterium]|nr:hypothetical protein [Planctomycetota bacterium]